MSLGSPIGSYPTRDEFQVDRTIVSIRVPDHGERQAWIAKGRRLYEDAASRVAEALRVAERFVRQELADESGTPATQGQALPRLAVRGIWIDPKDGTISYDIYDESDVLLLPQDTLTQTVGFSVSIEVTPDGELHILP